MIALYQFIMMSDSTEYQWVVVPAVVAAVEGTDNPADIQVQEEVDSGLVVDTAASTGYNPDKLEAVDEGDGCNHNQVVRRGCNPVVDTWDSCTVAGVEVVVAAVVVVPHIQPCHNDELVAADILLDSFGLDAEVDNDCNYSNYCKHNQSVECFLAFLCGFAGWQWSLVAILALHQKGNRAEIPRFLLGTAHQTFPHPGKHQPRCLMIPTKSIQKYKSTLNYINKLVYK